MDSEIRKPVAVMALVVIIFGAVIYIGFTVGKRLRGAYAATGPMTRQTEIADPPRVIVAHWDTDTSTDVNAMEEYQRAAGEALRQGQYEELDRIANEDRTKKLRFSGGTWKLLELYRGLSKPLAGDRATGTDWQSFIQNLEAWTKRNPNSITARVSLADAYLSYGYFARGEENINTVSQRQFQVFQERTEKAREILEEAHHLPDDCPHWYLTMLRVALQAEWKPAEEAALFERAFAYEPTYYTYYRERARYLQTKWFGKPGDFVRFADGIADRVGGDDGDRVYFEIAATCQCAEDGEFKGMKWARIKRGYMKLQSKYGASLVKTNQMAWLASQDSDPFYAAQLFAQLGDNWNLATWRARKYYVSSRDWANKFVEPGGAWPIAARANLATPPGRAYSAAANAEFHRKYARVLDTCRAEVADQLRAFDFYAKVTEDGTLSSVNPNPKNQFSDCVAPKLNGGALSAPPHGDYWVKLSVPEHE